MTNYMVGKYEIWRDRERRKNRRRARFMRATKAVLLIEMVVIGFEGMYRFGSLIRGYNSFGGESLLLIALAAFAAYRIRESDK